MGGWMIEHKGQWYSLPFDFECPDDTPCTMPNEVTVTIDEREFGRLFADAVWIDGAGPYLVLAYCRGLTVSRHSTLEAAIRSKRTIDHSGCGGLCIGVHLIGYADPADGHYAAREQAVARYIAENKIEPHKRLGN